MGASSIAGLLCMVLIAGCSAMRRDEPGLADVHDAIDTFVHDQRGDPAKLAKFAERTRYAVIVGPSNHEMLQAISKKVATSDEFTLGMVFGLEDAAPQSQTPSSQRSGADESTTAPTPKPAYWRPNLARQMGGEFKEFGTRDLWRGFKTTFWSVENEALLLSTLGASIAIRESGVDAAVRRRTDGEFKLGSMDETLQIIGNPAAHFAGAGVLWLGSELSKDLREHEVAQSLIQALCVNGITTVVLKVSTNTRSPDEEHYGWPSGHTSSAFTVAAVVNEYYGPWAGVPSFALAGLVGYQRIDSRVHDLSDVVFGAMLGYVIGSSIAKDQKAEFPELFGMKVIPYSDPGTGASGLALWKSW